MAEVLGDGAGAAGADPPWRIEFTEQVVGNRSPAARS